MTVYVSDEKLAARRSMQEHEWVITELLFVDLQIKYHQTNDHQRMISTLDEWFQYAVSLRNYTSLNADGIPEVLQHKRPIRPI